MPSPHFANYQQLMYSCTLEKFLSDNCKIIFWILFWLGHLAGIGWKMTLKIYILAIFLTKIWQISVKFLHGFLALYIYAIEKERYEENSVYNKIDVSYVCLNNKKGKLFYTKIIIIFVAFKSLRRCILFHHNALYKHSIINV